MLSNIPPTTINSYGLIKLILNNNCYHKTKEKNILLDLQFLQIFHFPKSAVRQGCNKIHVKLPGIS